MNVKRKLKRFFKRPLFSYAVGGLLAGFLNGLFGSGGGTVIVPFLEEGLGEEEHKAHATAILIISGLTLTSLFFYGFSGALDWKLSLYVSIGGVCGGFLGAKLLKKLTGSFLRKLFGTFMLIAALRMVFS